MTQIRAFLVDDEEPARDRLRGILEEIEDVEIAGEAGDGDEALKKITEARPDLVFLDIQMPGRSGMEVAAALAPPRPRLIFCTAYDQYAVDAFEHHAVDYLLKPVNRDRLRRAVGRVREAKAEEEEMRRELHEASAAQTRLLPQVLPALPTLDYAGVCRAARSVGGDYYDFLPLGQSRLGIALADVSGKGMFAGLLMAGLQARLQSLAPLHGPALDRLAAELNRSMLAVTETAKYATFFYGLYESPGRRLRYVNAGHQPPLLLRPGSAASLRLEPGGPVIGMLDDAAYASRSIDLRAGDILLIFSDGLTEAMNEADEQYGESRIESVVAAARSRSSEEICRLLLDDVDRFRGELPQQDDMTLVVLKVR